LDVILKVRVFDGIIRQITFEPMSIVFVSGESKEVVAINFVKKTSNYLYLDLGKRKFCTVKLPKAKVKAGDQSPKNYTEDVPAMRFCC